MGHAPRPGLFYERGRLYYHSQQLLSEYLEVRREAVIREFNSMDMDVQKRIELNPIPLALCWRNFFCLF